MNIISYAVLQQLKLRYMKGTCAFNYQDFTFTCLKVEGAYQLRNEILTYLLVNNLILSESESKGSSTITNYTHKF